MGLLQGHLSRCHGLYMCSLCLKGMKVFICQQKLYTKDQLARHTQKGDPQVDGSEAQRSGFAGHPICEFCRRAFYGDNELYEHMNREHYSCHICQRRHPGNHDYFRNYDELEVHFRRDHFLCEDDACLAKKFVVFQSDAEINRHNAMEHGGRMSRAQRNAALQIPTSFMYQRNEQDQRRGRGRGRNAHFDRHDSDFSLPVDGSAAADHGLGSRLDSARGSTMLGDESLFPPLPGSSNKCSASTQQGLQGLSRDTLASRLQKGTMKVLYSGRPRTAENPEIVPLVSTSTQTCPTPEPERNGSATAEHGLGSRVDSVTGPLQSLSVSSASSVRNLGNGRVLEQLSFPPLQGQDIRGARMDDVPDENSLPPLSEHQSRYELALNRSSRGSERLGDEPLFPPLAGSSNKGSASTQQGLQDFAKNTLASGLQQPRKGTVEVLNSGRPQTAENPEIVPHVSTSRQTCPTPERGRCGSATAEHDLGSRVDSVAGPLQLSSVSSASSGGSLGHGRVLEQLSFPPLLDQDIPDARMDAVPDETSFPPLSERQAKHALAVNQSSRGSARLADESLFPPLPGLSNKGSASTQQGLQSFAENTFASRLQQPRKGAMKVPSSCRSETAENPEMVPLVSTSPEKWPTPADQGLHLSGSSQLRVATRSTRDNGPMPPASSGSAWNSRAPNKMKHSVSTPNFVSAQASSRAYGNKKQPPPQSSHPSPVGEDVRQANNSLVERMRAALGMDDDKFSAFKEIACEYRHGVIGTSEYLSYVEQFGIAHLVPEMARLLPDPLKRKELADAYYTNTRFKSLRENGSCETTTLKEKLLQEGEAAVLSKDGYRSSKERIPLSAGGSSSGANMGLDGDPVAISKALEEAAAATTTTVNNQRRRQGFSELGWATTHWPCLILAILMM
ncbi:LIM domain and RING finger protein [Hordeum vulgare]|nr:LIM domain and RING finger protein [Hordeum vulgare]